MTLTTLAQTTHDIAKSWPGITKVEGQTDTRTVRNSSTISEHTFGNALDIYGSREALSGLANHLNGRKAELSIDLICYDPGVGRGYGTCTTKHTNHIHVDFSPNCGGSVSTDGTGIERASRCVEFQRTGQTTDSGGGGLVDSLTGGLVSDIGSFFMTGVGVLIGVAIAGVGVWLLIKDTETVKSLTAAAKTAVTKGAA